MDIEFSGSTYLMCYLADLHQDWICWQQNVVAVYWLKQDAASKFPPLVTDQKKDIQSPHRDAVHELSHRVLDHM
jgi:hypothetical protein